MRVTRRRPVTFAAKPAGCDMGGGWLLHFTNRLCCEAGKARCWILALGMAHSWIDAAPRTWKPGALKFRRSPVRKRAAGDTGSFVAPSIRLPTWRRFHQTIFSTLF